MVGEPIEVKKKHIFILIKKHLLKKKLILKKFYPNNKASAGLVSSPAERLTTVLCPLHVFGFFHKLFLAWNFALTVLEEKLWKILNRRICETKNDAVRQYYIVHTPIV